MRTLKTGWFAALIVVFTAAPGKAQTSDTTSKPEFYVIGANPSSVFVIDSKSLKPVTAISISPNPSFALVDSSSRFLYVLHNGKSAEVRSELTILDLDSRKPVKAIPLGYSTSGMSFSKDGRYLLCYSSGSPGKKEIKKEPAQVNVIDTQTQDIKTTLSGSRVGKQMLCTSDLSRIFVLEEGEQAKKKKDPPILKPALTVFALGSDKPLSEIEFDSLPAEMMLSRDERWLYLLDKGNPSVFLPEHRNGLLHVIDVESGKLVATHEVGEDPLRLDVDPETDAVAIMTHDPGQKIKGTSVETLSDAKIRSQGLSKKGKLVQVKDGQLTSLGDAGQQPLLMKRLHNMAGWIVVSYDQLRFVPDNDSLPSSIIPLNRSESTKQDSTLKPIDGFPVELLYLDRQNKVILSVNTGKVAIVNLKDNKVEKIIKTGRASRKFGNVMGSFAASMAMSGISYGLTSSQGYYYVFAYRSESPSLSLTASQDGKFIYALNTATDDVTIIRSEDDAVVDMVPIGGGCQRLFPVPGGKFICAPTPSKITFIDTETNQARPYDIPERQVEVLDVDEVGKRVIALTSMAPTGLTAWMMVWDVNSGELIAQIPGPSQPCLIVHPHQILSR